MKVVILAGGKGTRISEESIYRPKPMVEIGGIPVLVHIMRYFSAFGHHDFIICAGYRGQMIRDFFNNYYMYMAGAVTYDMKQNKTFWHNVQARVEPWTVTVVDTGLETMTGGRLKRIQSYLSDEPFFMTYGDGLANVNLNALHETYTKANTEAIVTAIRPSGRFGNFSIMDDKITGFVEKPEDEGGWINGGYFILRPSVLDRIANDSTLWEQEPLQSLAVDGQLTPYFHKGFWHPMDTLRDKLFLEDIWDSGDIPWRI